MVTYRQGDLGRANLGTCHRGGVDGFSVSVRRKDLLEAKGIICVISNLVSEEIVLQLCDNIEEGLCRALDKGTVPRPISPWKGNGAGFGDKFRGLVDREDADQVRSKIGDKDEVAGGIEDSMMRARLLLRVGQSWNRQGKGEVLDHGEHLGVRDVIGGDAASATKISGQRMVMGGLSRRGVNLLASSNQPRAVPKHSRADRTCIDCRLLGQRRHRHVISNLERDQSLVRGVEALIRAVQSVTSLREPGGRWAAGGALRERAQNLQLDISPRLFCRKASRQFYRVDTAGSCPIITSIRRDVQSGGRDRAEQGEARGQGGEDAVRAHDGVLCGCQSTGQMAVGKVVSGSWIVVEVMRLQERPVRLR